MKEWASVADPDVPILIALNDEDVFVTPMDIANGFADNDRLSRALCDMIEWNTLPGEDIAAMTLRAFMPHCS